jgi:hypothetical protein
MFDLGGKPAAVARRLADGGESGVPPQIDIEGLFPIRERPLSHAGRPASHDAMGFCGHGNSRWAGMKPALTSRDNGTWRTPAGPGCAAAATSARDCRTPGSSEGKPAAERRAGPRPEHRSRRGSECLTPSPPLPGPARCPQHRNCAVRQRGWPSAHQEFWRPLSGVLSGHGRPDPAGGTDVVRATRKTETPIVNCS